MIVGVAPNEHGDVAPQMVNGQHTANLAAREPSFSAMMTYMFDERRTFKELQDDYAAADALPGRTKMDKLGALDPEMVEHLNKKAEEFYQVDPTLAADRLGLPKSKKKKDEEGVDYFVEADRSRFLQWMMFLLTKGSKSIEDRAASANPQRQIEVINEYLGEYLVYRALAAQVPQSRANLVNINPFAGPCLYFLKQDREISEELIRNVIMEFAGNDSEDPMAKVLVEWLVENCSDYAGGTKWAYRILAATVATFASAIGGDEVPNLDIYTDASGSACAQAIRAYIDPIDIDIDLNSV